MDAHVPHDFLDELEKISAAHGRLKVPKERRGRRPMTVTTLLRKEKDGTLYKDASGERMNFHAFLDELMKIAAFANAMPPPATNFSSMEGRLNIPAPRMPGNIPSEQAAFATTQKIMDQRAALSAQRAPMPQSGIRPTMQSAVSGHAPTMSAAAAGPGFAPTVRPTPGMMPAAVPTARPGMGALGGTLRVPGVTGTARPMVGALAGRAEQAAATVAPGMLRRAAGALAHV